ncbi:hypothetical protein [Methylobacterium haplocladii]|uniref:Uncharacterized protein n=1 Tax=Methylobacterium haplocladii TaxID=1176176 RepID=A0A512IS40_9HYPH|nr:hypothetical protein [Methylobacterium haplocladii]GEP00524.1 hypothetical protein MHA02_29110 [Methylobacterium haplocladii]GJD85439.1 hypothetical protein HPGCJGGD_3328 [Methylobacterium haplocladii]GLS57824.1 hypothetical protein GCM10007887_04800 [Methylobacterium haplocladii]
MLRTSLAAAVGAIIGALCYATVEERVRDQLWAPVEATSLGLVALLAFSVVLFGMVLREPRAAVLVQAGDLKPVPQRDRLGRFRKQ